MTEMIILFVVLQLVNVVLQTLKSIITVKGTTTQSALMNALAYGVYTVIVVFTAGTFTGDYLTDLVIKIAVTMGTNLIGVYISAWILNKFKKDKLWKVESTICWDYVPNIPHNDQKNKFLNGLIDKINAQNLSYHYIELPKREFLFSFYCKTQKESLALKEILKDYNAKYIVQEENVKL
jgi:hypothetical protein